MYAQTAEAKSKSKMVRTLLGLLILKFFKDNPSTTAHQAVTYLHTELNTVVSPKTIYDTITYLENRCLLTHLNEKRKNYKILPEGEELLLKTLESDGKLWVAFKLLMI
jgi:DNA-binding PadR family transcriptional regulator